MLNLDRTALAALVLAGRRTARVKFVWKAIQAHNRAAAAASLMEPDNVDMSTAFSA